MSRRYGRELSVATEAATRAAEAIMDVYDTAAVHTKADGSPVTEADLASDRIIRELIGSAFPADAILTEEGVDDRDRLVSPRCWIVDPIDGTASFVAREGDFDVYIALVIEHRPVVAVTIQPTTGLLLTATDGEGAWIGRIGGVMAPLRFDPAGAAPRLGTRLWLGAPGNLPALERVARTLHPRATAVFPDSGLNVRSLVGKDRIVDAMVGLPVDDERLDAHEWDVAAVDLIVREAGGASSDLDGTPLRFNQPRPIVDNLLMSADPALHVRILAALASEL